MSLQLDVAVACQVVLDGEVYPASLRVLPHQWSLQVQEWPRATTVAFARLFQGETHVRITPVGGADVYEGYAEVVQYVPDVSVNLRGLDDLKCLERERPSGPPSH